jgi:hypothetical protein
LKNNTAGVREREDENRTREAGNLNEIQGVVANRLDLFRNGAAGFIDWLGLLWLHGETRGLQSIMWGIVIARRCKQVDVTVAVDSPEGPHDSGVLLIH